MSSLDLADWWDDTYRQRGVDKVSWFQSEPAMSLELLEVTELPRSAAVIDVGAGASVLVDRLVTRGFTDVSVLDVSALAIGETRARLGPQSVVNWLPRRRQGRGGPPDSAD